MNLGLLIYGSLDTLSGGYLYDRKLVDSLRAMGDTVEIISLPWRNYLAHLSDNLRFRLPYDIASPADRVARARRAYRDKGAKQSPNPLHLPHSQNLDLLIQDELNHPSLLAANAQTHPYPVVSLVHHLRCSEQRPAWQNTLYRLIEKRYLRSVDGFIFNSRTTKEAVTSLIGDDKPSILAYPPTDRFGLQVTEEEVIRRAESGELRILFLGNVIERKGLHTLLKAVRLQTSAIRVDVVGSLSTDPAYARRMQDLAARPVSGRQASVFFHSSLDNAPLITLLKSAHVLAVPSSYEGFGIVYLEGMGFGLPAIATTAGAAGEIITDGADGFLIHPGDASSLADRLMVLDRDRGILICMSLAARERYLRQPSWEQTAASIRLFLEELVRKKTFKHEVHEKTQRDS